MANAGTLLSDLETRSPVAGDGDLVNMIYQDMNKSESVNQRPGVAPGGVQNGGMMNPMPPPQSTMQYQTDSFPPTAHIIGGQHPTSADFANMLQSSQPGFAAAGNWTSGNHDSTHLAAQIASIQSSQGKSGMIAEELKIPILIAILVFIVNLPFLSVLVAHYSPWMLKSSGDMNVYGQISKALLVGLAFLAVNKVIFPLLG